MTKKVLCGTVCLLAAIITGVRHTPTPETAHAKTGTDWPGGGIERWNP